MKKIFSFLLTACNTAATGEEKLIKENTVEKDSIVNYHEPKGIVVLRPQI
ncbi:hypothetical protein [Ectobacillus panaciterrae]|nr:hypothetical protein [Ectobacillus panaciterrae]